jgi:hypothetical protein
MVGDAPITRITADSGVQVLHNDLFRFGKKWTKADFRSIPDKGYCAILLLHRIYLEHHKLEAQYTSDLREPQARFALAEFIAHVLRQIQAFPTSHISIPQHTSLILQGYVDALRHPQLSDPQTYSPAVVLGITNVEPYLSQTEHSDTELWLPSDQFTLLCVVLGLQVSFWLEDAITSMFPEGWVQLQSSSTHALCLLPMSQDLSSSQSASILAFPCRVAFSNNHFFLLGLPANTRNALIQCTCARTAIVEYNFGLRLVVNTTQQKVRRDLLLWV